MANLRAAAGNAAQIGFDRPACGSFGIAVWLRETVAPKLSQFQAAFDSARGACQAMSEVARLRQICRKHSDALTQLKLGDRENQTYRQNLEQKIQSLSQRKAEIAEVVVAVSQWIETADACLDKAVKSCWETGELLTDNMLELPGGLLKIARSLKMPIVPPKCRVNLPDLARLQKALSHEENGGFKDIQGQQFRFSEFLHLNLSQTPIVLAADDRAQWQQLAADFANYSQIRGDG